MISLAIADLFGMAARAIRLPPVLGCLIAGVAAGPFTAGFVVDRHIVSELAHIGMALLLFGVGLHFSLANLPSARRIAVPGALVQIAGSTAVGIAECAPRGFAVDPVPARNKLKNLSRARPQE